MGQQFSHPAIKYDGLSARDFAPRGWIVLDSATGDLNNDQLSDLAFVLQHKNSISLIKTADGYSDTVTTQPRILVIAFYSPSAKQFIIAEQSNSFILHHDNPNMEDPFDTLLISNGVLQIDFHIWMNMGSWTTSNNSYEFSYQDGQFKLVSAEYFSVDRASGDTEDRSYHFLSKEVKISTGNISRKKVKTKSRPIAIDELKTLKTFEQPFTWEVEAGFYL